jgi:glutamyl-Q tRNA(Asp) synthetase
LHARQAGGEWLVRIDDIDPPREVPGSADEILRTLEALGLEWDREVLYQSSRFHAYRAVTERLLLDGLAFRCRCSRSELRAGADSSGAAYPGTCRSKQLPAPDTAVRMRVEPGLVTFEDGLQGPVEADLATLTGDYVIVRRDGLPAYHLAVVLDDAYQGVTGVVRGIDLLDSTPTHVHLQRALGLATPQYWHLPVVVNARGQKLSKQNHAPPLSGREPGIAARVLALLGAEVPAALRDESPPTLWQWALAHWNVGELHGKREVRA